MDLEVYLLTRGRDVPRHSHYLQDSRATIYREEGCSEGQRYLAKLKKNWHIKLSLSCERCHLEVKQHQITDLTFLKVHDEKFMIYTQDFQFHIFIQTIPPFQFQQKKATLHFTFIRTILIQNIRVYEIIYICIHIGFPNLTSLWIVSSVLLSIHYVIGKFTGAYIYILITPTFAKIKILVIDTFKVEFVDLRQEKEGVFVFKCQ